MVYGAIATIFYSEYGTIISAIIEALTAVGHKLEAVPVLAETFWGNAAHPSLQLPRNPRNVLPFKSPCWSKAPISQIPLGLSALVHEVSSVYFLWHQARLLSLCSG